MSKKQSKLHKIIIILKKHTHLIIVISLLFFILYGNNRVLGGAADTTDFPKKQYKITKVVIDAGHGGKDPGALGKKSKEKDITLSIALKLGNYIKTNFPDVKVIYTRKTDEFVELHRRAQIANENKADLFISIHCNASKNKESYGAETFVMGIHKSQANLEVAKKENASILYEDNYIEKYDGYNPNSDEAHIIFQLFQNLYLEQSLLFASYVQDNFKEKLKRFDRGVKQAGFLVLYRTTMPSVLIEVGFISNYNEELFLSSPKGQDYIASAIYKAFRAYKANLEGREITKDATDEIVYEKIAPDPTDTISSFSQNDTIASKIEVNPNIPINKTNNKITLRVQVHTSAQKVPLNSPQFEGLKDMWEYKSGDFYKYTTGEFTKLSEAFSYMRDVKNKGFKDAFVVAFSNDERIPLDEARKYLKE